LIGRRRHRQHDAGLLARRKTEIAMLKTAGYMRAPPLPALRLEAALLGLLGGLLGAAAASASRRRFARSLNAPSG